MQPITEVAGTDFAPPSQEPYILHDGELLKVRGDQPNASQVIDLFWSGFSYGSIEPKEYKQFMKYIKGAKSGTLDLVSLHADPLPDTDLANKLLEFYKGEKLLGSVKPIVFIEKQGREKLFTVEWQSSDAREIK